MLPAPGHPREEWGIDPEATWPGVDDDPGEYVRRVWARWHAVTEAEVAASPREVSPEDLRWVESAVPGEGLYAVSVVDLADG